MPYIALPAFRAPSPLDFSGLNEGIDTYAKAREKNRLLQEQKDLGATLTQPVQSDPGSNPYQAQPVNRLLSPKSSPAQYQSGSIVDRIVGAESGGNATATNPRSSATGAGQFINSTWLSTIKQARPDLAAGKSDQELLSLRTDPNLSREMTAAYASENGRALQGAGFEATPGNTYLAHFAGPAGARSVLGADPNAPVRQVLGDRVVQANPFLANMTAGQLRQWADRKMGGASQSAVAQSSAPQPRPSGLNYAAGIQKALQQGNIGLATQLRNAQQEEEATAYNRQRQGTMDALSAESQGLTIQGKREELQQNAVKKIGAIAQVIQSQADPTKKAQMWQRFLSSDPSFGPDLQAMGVDPSDVEAGTRMLIAQAGGGVETSRPIEVGGNLVQKQPDGSYKSVYTAPTKARNLSVNEQKEVFEADEGVQAGNNVVNSLTKALELNDKAYSGLAAGTRGYLGSIVGAEGGTATEDLTNLVTSQVLENLKATFGGAPTEGERQILLDVQGSVSKTPEVRKRVYERAIQAANRRIEFNKQKATALRSGEYFQPGFTPASPSQAQVEQQAATQAPAGQPVRVNTPDEAMKLPSGTVFQTPDGRTKVRP